MVEELIGCMLGVLVEPARKFGEWLGELSVEHPKLFWALIPSTCQTFLAAACVLLLPYALGAVDALSWIVILAVVLTPLLVYVGFAWCFAAIVWRWPAAGGILLLVEGLLVLAVARLLSWLYLRYMYLHRANYCCPKTPLLVSAELSLGALPLAFGILILIRWWKSRRTPTLPPDSE
jgi:hypothetical protein